MRRDSSASAARVRDGSASASARLGVERPRHAADADDDGAVVVQLDGVADLQRDLRLPVGGRAGEHALGADVVDDDPVRPAQVGQLALHHHRRAADEGGVVDAGDDAGLVVAVVQPGLDQPAVHRHRPLHAVDSPDAEQLRAGHGLYVVDELDVGFHGPDVDAPGVGDGAVGPGHEADENTRLLRDEQRGEGQPHDDAEVLGPVAHEHFQRDEVHEPLAPSPAEFA